MWTQRSSKKLETEKEDNTLFPNLKSNDELETVYIFTVHPSALKHLPNGGVKLQ